MTLTPTQIALASFAAPVAISTVQLGTPFGVSPNVYRATWLTAAGAGLYYALTKNRTAGAIALGAGAAGLAYGTMTVFDNLARG